MQTLCTLPIHAPNLGTLGCTQTARASAASAGGDRRERSGSGPWAVRARIIRVAGGGS